MLNYENKNLLEEISANHANMDDYERTKAELITKESELNYYKKLAQDHEKVNKYNKNLYLKVY
jgi:hypothetical protein